MHFRTNIDNQQFVQHFQLPAVGAAGQSDQVHLEKDHGSIKLRMGDDETGQGRGKSGDSAIGIFPLSHTFLADIRCEGLVCDNCESDLARWSPSVTYRALPSDHWEELIEAWMCHSDQRLHESIAKGRDAVQRSGAGDEREEVWVGDFHLAVTRGKLVGAAVEEFAQDSDGSTDERRGVICQHCKIRVGHEVESGSHSHSMASDSAIRFDKYAVRPNNAGMRYPSALGVMIANQMGSLAGMYGARHFELIREGSGAESGSSPSACVLWLFAPRIRVGLSSPNGWTQRLWNLATAPPTSSSPSSAFNASKILYRHSSNGAASAAHAETQSPPGQPRTEQLQLPDRTYDRLIELLALSTEGYPPSRRRFGPWNVGWLEV
ncbi:hypothetical protein V8E36_006157 [Tilletia maclaganii]